MRGLAGRRTRDGRECRLEKLTDAELLARHFAAGGEDGAWIGELFRRHYPKVVAWCLRMAGDRDDAHDLAQAVFTKAYRHLGSFRGESRWSTWLYAITRSECMNFLEAKRGRPAAVSDDAAAAEIPADEESVDLTLERQGAARAVHALLDETLDETEKRIFTLHYGDDVPLHAITRLLGLTNRSGAKAYIVSARRKLARALRSWKTRDPALDV